KPKGGLDLATFAGVRAGGESGSAIVPGKPAESLLLDYVAGDEPLMPQAGRPLSESEVATLRAWIAEGAGWPEGLKLESRDGGGWWSLQPLAAPPVPRIDSGIDSDWLRTPIDAFILAKLGEQKLAPAPQADRRTLIRRLSFDLHG